MDSKVSCGNNLGTSAFEKGFRKRLVWDDNDRNFVGLENGIHYGILENVDHVENVLSFFLRFW